MRSRWLSNATSLVPTTSGAESARRIGYGRATAPELTRYVIRRGAGPALTSSPELWETGGSGSVLTAAPAERRYTEGPSATPGAVSDGVLMLQPRHFSPGNDLATDADRRANATAEPMARAGNASGHLTPDAPDDWYEIIVGYDGSEPAKRALARASRLANERSRVVVVAIAEPYPRSGVTIPANEDAAEIRRRGDELREAQTMLRERGVQAEMVHARGNVAQVLIEASKDADLVILGSRKINRFRRLVLGSVSSRVVHDAACDVLVVR
jgi:nucleotide-binding universal stress UspA family protein